MTAQIARSLAAEARDGTLATGTAWCDSDGAACTQATARFRTDTTKMTFAGNCTRLTIVVTAVDAPNRPSCYAVILPPS